MTNISRKHTYVISHKKLTYTECLRVLCPCVEPGALGHSDDTPAP